MAIVSQILFALLLAATIFLAMRGYGRIIRAIRLGRPEDRSNEPGQRLRNVFTVALGQSKMVRRKTLAGVLHVFVYVGFLVINIEVLEIIVDGLFGTHRVLGFLGVGYSALTWIAEVFFVLVLAGTVGFLLRRDVKKVKRFEGEEMKRWNHLDAHIILWTEVVLITALTIMNASDSILQQRGVYETHGSFPWSSLFAPLFAGLSNETLIVLERAGWWVHIVGILAFLNYIPYSKHLHIFLSFFNVYFSNTNVKPLGRFPINEKVKQEVQLMLSGDPFAAPAPDAAATDNTEKFGARDVHDLRWTDVLSAFSCTECGRCTNACPANITGKRLSPRKIVMDVRDRAEEIIRKTDANKGVWVDDGKAIIGDYTTPEELWACTTCNACAEACPVNINPLGIIMQERQFLVMEQSAAPAQLNGMFNNIENAGTPWAFSPSDRFNWASNVSLANKAQTNS